jgi:hypothetical protein
VSDYGCGKDSGMLTPSEAATLVFPCDHKSCIGCYEGECRAAVQNRNADIAGPESGLVHIVCPKDEATRVAMTNPHVPLDERITP